MAGEDKDRLGVQGILNEPDPVVNVVSNVFRRNRNQPLVSARRSTAKVARQGRGRGQSSPVGAAFGNLAALGVAKLLGSGVRDKRNRALQEKRFQQTEARQVQQANTQEQNVESLVERRAADTAQGAKRLGIQEAEQTAIQDRFNVKSEREKREFGIKTELKMFDIAQKAGLPLTGKKTGFKIPAQVGTSSFSDAKKAQIKFLEGLREEARGTGQFVTPERQKDLDRINNEIATLVGSPRRFGENANATREFEQNRQNRGVAGAAIDNNNLGVR
jgi:hypothetical protein